MAISNAVSTEYVAKVVGYELSKGTLLNSTPNLPMRIAVFGQANTDKQAGITNTPKQVTSENEVGQTYGFGSQLHIAMRILRSRFGDAIGGIPTIVYPQLAPGGGVAQVSTITITGPATGNAVHIVRINGRSNYDGASLEISIADADTDAVIAQKIADAINAAQSCPVSAIAALGVVTLTTKWVGESAAELEIEVDLQEKAVGLAYGIAEVTPGAGDSSAEITASLDLFGNDWNTIVINPYPKSRNALFEVVNGVPGEIPGTGKYSPLVFKPFIVLNGDTTADTVANVIASLDKDQATIVQCPAPNSKGWNVEAAANACVLLARQAQDSPHLDISGKFYPDMPVPQDGNIGIFTNYVNRDLIVKGGAATVIISNGRYKVEDFITTYHPDNEIPPQFRYVRSLIQDWNIRFGYFLLEQINVVDHAIVADDQPVNVDLVLKPKQWKAILGQYFLDLNERALIVDVDFSDDSLQVGTNATNPDRLETFFRYKRSAFGRILSTTGEANFAFNL